MSALPIDRDDPRKTDRTDDESDAALGRVAIVGGGPAGLMAAEVLSTADVAIDLYDAMPSVGRKFLLAGIGGLNLTHSEPFESFVSRYGEAGAALQPMLAAFDPAAVREWARGLGVETFIGTSGRVFPQSLKAAPLLRAWLHRLRARGVRVHARHRCIGWVDDSRGLRFATSEGERRVHADAVLLALGGASWPQLGSDGAWQPWLAERGVAIAPLKPANCGFDVGHAGTEAIGWSAHFRERHAGQPIKPVAIECRGEDGSLQFQRQGEFIVTRYGIEGSLVYAAAHVLRDAIERHGEVVLHLDLLPDRRVEFIAAELARPRGSQSSATHWKRRLGIEGAKAGLLHEVLLRDEIGDPHRLAERIKHLPLRLVAPRPIAEAISTAGGVRFDALDADLMLREVPGVWCAGEMLDWEAPTGGYLLTGCLASGRHAALGMLRRLTSP